MTVAEVQNAVKADLKVLSPRGGTTKAGCVDTELVGGPPGLSLSFQLGRLRVISVDGSAIQTDRGVGIGSPEGEVLSSYPSAARTEGLDGPALAVPEGSSELFMYTAAGRVRLIEAGADADVRTYEGCT